MSFQNDIYDFDSGQALIVVGNNSTDFGGGLSEEAIANGGTFHSQGGPGIDLVDFLGKKRMKKVMLLGEGGELVGFGGG